MATGEGQKAGGLEVRSIDFVPLNERHGKGWHLGPLWFMSNAHVATLAVGLISITSGASLLWSITAILAGVLVGTTFMAAHSAQGPQMGLPQMIQSRPQFGYVGALLVWVFAYVQYAGFNVFNTVLAADSAKEATGGSSKVWIVVLTLIAMLIAVVGYDIIHRCERVLTYTTIAVFGALTITLFFLHYPAGTFTDFGSFKGTAFLAQFGVVAGYQVSWAIYVSDYSRYLPPSVSVPKTFMWTFGGSAIGGSWMMIVGSVLVSWVGVKSFSGTGIPELKAAGDHAFHGLGSVVLIVSTLGVMSVTALNMYGGSLTLISALDSFRRVKQTVMLRVVTVVLTAALSLWGALAANADFLSSFNDFLLLILYLFIPWTAVNLVDFYVVRRGHYAIRDIFKADGIYGRWGWRGIIAYAVGFAAMVPFFSVGTFYQGPVAKQLDGADISFFVGLPVAGILYWILARSIDLDAERAAIAESNRYIEQESAAGHVHAHNSDEGLAV